MGKGFDCASPLSAAIANIFASQGCTFVGRYLADPGSWKRMSPTEARIISNSGLYIVSFMERYAERAGEGACAGTEDGKLAYRLAKEVGQPEGSAIYFAVDFDAQPCDYDAVEAYMRSADAEIPGYELGVYGSFFVVEEMLRRGVAVKLMQTVAWSRGKRSANAQIYQSQIDTIKNGIGIDIDESNGDAGGWKVGMAINQTSLDQEVAKGVLKSYLKKDYAEKDAAYQACVAAGDTAGAEANKQILDTIRGWGAAIKAASGLPADY